MSRACGDIAPCRSHRDPKPQRRCLVAVASMPLRRCGCTSNAAGFAAGDVVSGVSRIRGASLRRQNPSLAMALGRCLDIAASPARALRRHPLRSGRQPRMRSLRPRTPFPPPTALAALCRASPLQSRLRQARPPEPRSHDTLPPTPLRRHAARQARSIRADMPLAGPIAQRLEQRTHNPLVHGSNPCGPTNSFRLLHLPDRALPGRSGNQA